MAHDGGRPPAVARCRRELIARGAGAQVEFCAPCGVVHFTVGGLTMRLVPDACRDMAETLAAALVLLERRVRAARRPPSPHLRLLAGGVEQEVTPAT